MQSSALTDLFSHQSGYDWFWHDDPRNQFSFIREKIQTRRKDGLHSINPFLFNILIEWTNKRMRPEFSIINKPSHQEAMSDSREISALEYLLTDENINYARLKRWCSSIRWNYIETTRSLSVCFGKKIHYYFMTISPLSGNRIDTHIVQPYSLSVIASDSYLGVLFRGILIWSSLSLVW